jgi:hypothetical protein
MGMEEKRRGNMKENAVCNVGGVRSMYCMETSHSIAEESREEYPKLEIRSSSPTHKYTERRNLLMLKNIESEREMKEFVMHSYLSISH